MARDVAAQVRQLFDGLTFETAIHQSDSVGRAAGRGIPIVIDAPNRREAREFHQLAEEVIARGTK